MKNFASGLLFLAIVSLAACSPAKKDAKKLFVISSGQMQIDPAHPELIKLDPSLQHNEQVLSFKEDGKVTVTVEITGGEKKLFDMTDNGTYLLNLKSDTVIGSEVNYGALGVPASISADELTRIIDSTQQLMTGKNASDASKSFWLPPMSIHRISASNNAVILSPYKNIPYKVEVDENGQSPEMYKFFTNKQKREALADLTKRLGK